LEDGIFSRGSLDNKGRHPARDAEVQNFQTGGRTVPPAIAAEKTAAGDYLVIGKVESLALNSRPGLKHAGAIAALGRLPAFIWGTSG